MGLIRMVSQQAANTALGAIAEKVGAWLLIGGHTKQILAEKLGMSVGTLNNRLSGEFEWSWSEGATWPRSSAASCRTFDKGVCGLSFAAHEIGGPLEDDDDGESPPFLFEDRLQFMQDVLFPLYFEHVRGGRRKRELDHR